MMANNAYYYNGKPTPKTSDHIAEMDKNEIISSSSLGLRNILDTSQPKSSKFLWAIIMTIFFSIAVFQIVDRIQHYLSQPVDLEYKIEISSRLTYPSLSICPFYGFETTKLGMEMSKRGMSTNSSVHDLLSFSDMDLEKLWNLTDNELPALMPVVSKQF